MTKIHPSSKYDNQETNHESEGERERQTTDRQTDRLTGDEEIESRGWRVETDISICKGARMWKWQRVREIGTFWQSVINHGSCGCNYRSQCRYCPRQGKPTVPQSHPRVLCQSVCLSVTAKHISYWQIANQCHNSMTVVLWMNWSYIERTPPHD